MAKKMTKTEQGRATRAAETAARAAATQGRRDSAAAAQERSERRVGPSAGTGERMSQREAAAGSNLAGNNTMSGRGQPMPTMSEREEAAGLNLAGNDTMSGRSDPFYELADNLPSTDEAVDHGVHDNTNDTLPSPVSSFPVIICRNGKPFSASIQGIVGNEIT